MTTPLEHLQAALDHLNEARNKAGIGTSMMVQQIIDELEPLVERTKINEEEHD